MYYSTVSIMTLPTITPTTIRSINRTRLHNFLRWLKLRDKERLGEATEQIKIHDRTAVTEKNKANLKNLEKLLRLHQTQRALDMEYIVLKIRTLA